jgi:predicted nucleic acid-binding protein
VRFFTGRPIDMAEAAKAIVAAADKGEAELEIRPVIVAETLYTLESYYSMDRKDVASKLMSFLRSRGIHPTERERLLDALQRHHDHNVHFADCYLAAAGAESHAEIASFDRDLDKFKDVKRFEPKK